MEYLLGSLVTLVTILFVNRIINKKVKSLNKLPKLFYSQSIVHATLSPLLPSNAELKNTSNIKRQSKNHQSKTTMRVLFLQDKAYWIQDNIFYTADLVEGLVDEETKTKVDIMGMDKVQLEEMSFIVEKLTEGIDDENRYSGQ
jgi:hypothetical protein